jgi:CRP/FNR family transcriptional regulator, nitrogen oxide reductase regulator
LKTDITELLKNIPIFAVLQDSELTEIASLSQEKKFTSTESIFWEGDPSDWFYIVIEGKVKISKLTSTAKEIVLSFFGPGEIFGEVAVLENGPYPASAQAVDPSRLIGIRKADFWNFLLKHPAVALKIISLLSARLREAQSRLRDLAGERVEQRLARLLLRLNEKLGATLPFTRQELSDMSGTTTETAIRTLSQWKDQGVVSSVRGKTTIVDVDKLRKLAEG